MKRKCSKCKQVKGLLEFPRHKNRSLGRDCQCKECKRKYRKPIATKLKDAQKKKLWYKRHPLAKRAHCRIERELKAGRIRRPNRCESCDSYGQVHAHHDNYSKPDEVEWLCVLCHRSRHLALELAVSAAS